MSDLTSAGNSMLTSISSFSDSSWLMSLPNGSTVFVLKCRYASRSADPSDVYSDGGMADRPQDGQRR